MDVSDKVGTLRAEMHGNIPCVVSAGFRNGNSAQSRIIGLEMELSPTIPAEPGGNKACVVTNQPCVLPFNTTQITSPKNGNNPKWGDPCHCLASTDHPPAVIIENHPQDSRVNIDESGTIQTLTKQMGTGGGNVPMVMAHGQSNAETLSGQSPTLNCNHEQPILASDYAVRRLTPLECERLQGFPDGWTNILGASDSARYKALGNSVAIPCVEYVVEGIMEVLTNVQIP